MKSLRTKDLGSYSFEVFSSWTRVVLPVKIALPKVLPQLFCCLCARDAIMKVTGYDIEDLGYTTTFIELHFFQVEIYGE